VTSAPVATTSPHTHLPGQQKKTERGKGRKAKREQGRKQKKTKEKKAKGERRPPPEEEAKHKRAGRGV